MRVLFLTNYYPPFEVGGYEQLCRDVAMRLEARGHIVAVLTSDRGVTQSKGVDEPGIFRHLRLQPQHYARLSPVAQSFLTRRTVETQNRHAFRAVVQQWQPEVVFVWNLEGLPHELAADAEVLSGVSVAYWLAGISPAEPDAFWRYWTQPPGRRSSFRFVKRVLSRVALAQMRREGKPVSPKMQHVAVVSEYIRRKGWVEGWLPANAAVIYNGVETELFYRPVPTPDAPPPLGLLSAGRVSPDKGVHVAIEAVGILAKARPQRDFRLTVAGVGPPDYLARLQELSASNGCADLIWYTGWLPREQMPELMHQCHILLLPTVTQEPFSRVTLEGMAAGLAVIGTLTGGTGELLQDGVNALTCAAGDSAGLARQIASLLDDPELRYRLALRGQATVLEQYTLERMVDRVEDLLERAVLEQRSSGVII